MRLSSGEANIGARAIVGGRGIVIVPNAVAEICQEF